MACRTPASSGRAGRAAVVAAGEGEKLGTQPKPLFRLRLSPAHDGRRRGVCPGFPESEVSAPPAPLRTGPSLPSVNCPGVKKRNETRGNEAPPSPPIPVTAWFLLPRLSAGKGDGRGGGDGTGTGGSRRGRAGGERRRGEAAVGAGRAVGRRFHGGSFQNKSW